MYFMGTNLDEKGEFVGPPTELKASDSTVDGVKKRGREIIYGNTSDAMRRVMQSKGNSQHCNMSPRFKGQMRASARRAAEQRELELDLEAEMLLGKQQIEKDRANGGKGLIGSVMEQGTENLDFSSLSEDAQFLHNALNSKD